MLNCEACFETVISNLKAPPLIPGVSGLVGISEEGECSLYAQRHSLPLSEMSPSLENTFGGVDTNEAQDGRQRALGKAVKH